MGAYPAAKETANAQNDDCDVQVDKGLSVQWGRTGIVLTMPPDPFNHAMELLIETLKNGGPGMFLIVLQDLILAGAMLVPRRAAWCVVLLGLASSPTVTGLFFYRHEAMRSPNVGLAVDLTPMELAAKRARMRHEARPLLWFGGGSTVIGAAVLHARCRRRGAAV